MWTEGEMLECVTFSIKPGLVLLWVTDRHQVSQWTGVSSRKRRWSEFTCYRNAVQRKSDSLQEYCSWQQSSLLFCSENTTKTFKRQKNLYVTKIYITLKNKTTVVYSCLSEFKKELFPKCCFSTTFEAMILLKLSYFVQTQHQVQCHSLMN